MGSQFIVFLQVLGVIIFIALILSRIIPKKKCVHDWYCPASHQSHDIGINVYYCRNCSEVENRLE